MNSRKSKATDDQIYDFSADLADPAGERHRLVEHVMNCGEFQDLKFPDSTGDRDLDHVAHFFSDQTSSYGRAGGDLSAVGVSLFTRHQRIGELFILLDIQHDDFRT